jgi:PII-like signaling protein
MGIELFGGHYTTYFAIACFVAYFVSGHSGIYQSQRLGVPKRPLREMPPEISLREAREWQGNADSMSLARLLDRWPISKYFPKLNGPNSAKHLKTMKDKHNITSHDMGKIRIYLKPGERLPTPGFWGRLNPKPVYRVLIHAAKEEGIRTAVAYMTHYGFTAKGSIERQEAEIPNSHLTLCVELIDEKVALEAFCHRHGALLQGKTVIYKPVEHWVVRAGETTLKKPAQDEIATGQGQLVRA